MRGAVFTVVLGLGIYAVCGIARAASEPRRPNTEFEPSALRALEIEPPRLIGRAPVRTAAAAPVPEPQARDVLPAAAEAAAESPSKTRRMDPATAALHWLQAHQEENGGWAARGYRTRCKGETVPVPEAYEMDGGRAAHDVGVTGLALCAFLGAGYTQRGNHAFKQAVRRGIRHLRDAQLSDGSFAPGGTRSRLLDHAWAAFAMTEAYAMTESPVLRRPAQRALDFIAHNRNSCAGWGDLQRGRTDLLATGLMLLPIQSARLSNIDVHQRGGEPRLELGFAPAAIDGALIWLDATARDATEHASSATATAYLMRAWGRPEHAPTERMHQTARRIALHPPRWDVEAKTTDALRWWQETLVMSLRGGKAWRTWRRSLVETLYEAQDTSVDLCQGRGSWAPVGVWGRALGRVGTTALMTLSLELGRCYGRVYGCR